MRITNIFEKGCLGIKKDTSTSSSNYKYLHVIYKNGIESQNFNLTGESCINRCMDGQFLFFQKKDLFLIQNNISNKRKSSLPIITIKEFKKSLQFVLHSVFFISS
jgi:hypothetical protein